MTDLTISQLQKQSHELARKNGWHEQKRNPLESHMLIVSEIAEATEEARKGKDPIWYGQICENFSRKPEGELIELADAMIRIAEYAESRGWDLEKTSNLFFDYDKVDITIKEFSEKSLVYSGYRITYSDLSINPLEFHAIMVIELMSHVFIEEIRIVKCMIAIAAYCDFRGWDLTEAINLKHEYNKTRSYRHGGKLY